MKLLGIKDIEKKDIPLYYRNEYMANSEFSLLEENIKEIKIYFAIEMLPTGEKKIEIKLREKIEYPLVPILKVLKIEIEKLEQSGSLL